MAGSACCMSVVRYYCKQPHLHHWLDPHQKSPCTPCLHTPACAWRCMMGEMQRGPDAVTPAPPSILRNPCRWGHPRAQSVKKKTVLCQAQPKTCIAPHNTHAAQGMLTPHTFPWGTVYSREVGKAGGSHTTPPSSPNAAPHPNNAPPAQHKTVQ